MKVQRGQAPAVPTAAPKAKTAPAAQAKAAEVTKGWAAKGASQASLQPVTSSAVPKAGVRSAVFEAQLKSWDKLTADLGKDPFFKKVVDSQRAWAKRVVYYDQFNTADFRAGYEHVFGKLTF